MTNRPLHEVLCITTEEMWAMVHEPPPLQSDVPQFYSVDRSGVVSFFPPLDPAKMLVYVCYEGDF